MTEVNESLSEWIADYNYSKNSKKLTFSEVRVYKENSFDFKVLSYFAETATYNLCLVTYCIITV